MSNLTKFMKVLKHYGYPNSKIMLLAQMVGYDLDNFLSDLEKELGSDGVTDFCEKAIYKFTGDKGLKVDLAGPNGDEYVYVHIYPLFYDKNESEYDIISNYSWGESRILSTDDEGEDVYITIDELIKDTDMGEWSNLNDLIDSIKESAYNKVFSNCGFGIWWQ